LRPFTIYRSSAGSGKTRTLAKEYLKLALRNRANYFRHILAVTFANKATQEMKDRILDYLDTFTRDTQDALAIELQHELHLDAPTFQQYCAELRSEILHHYDQFGISTIDAFFQKVIRSFTREAGLMGDYRLEIDQNMVMEEVIENLFDELGSNRELTKWVVQFAKENLENDQGWDTRKSLLDFSKEIFREEFRVIESEIRKNTGDPKFFSAIQQELIKVTRGFQSRVAEHANHILQTLRDNDWKATDLKYSGAGLLKHLQGYSAKLKIQKMEFPEGRFRSDFVHGRDWPKKESLRYQEIKTEAERTLAPEAASIVNLFDTEYATALSAELMLDNLYVFGLVTDLSRKLQEYKYDNNIMLLADAPAFLNGIIQDSDTPFIYEKIGSFYRNYLIDEFQDTSGLQWKNFLPLLVNGLDQMYPSLIVGDVKQSIYRWRSGDLTLLQQQVETQVGKGRVEIRNLNRNFRSAQSVVHFNNAIFRSIPVQMADSFTQEVYHDVKQEIERKENGFVRVAFLQKNEDQSMDEMVLDTMTAYIEKLQLAGASLRDIAILVRRNGEGQQVADHLLHYKETEKAHPECGYDVISNESLRLEGAATVNLLLGALRYLLDTEDRVAKAQVAFEYARLHTPDRPLEEIFQVTNSMLFEGQLPEEFVSQKLSLKKLPLFELTETLIRIFKIGTVKGELAYLQAFQDLVLEFYSRERNDLASFLLWWEENRESEKTSIKVSADTDAMQILTIHKSKGLQFKYVIIPFCSWNTDHQGGNAPRLWVRTETAPLHHAGYMPIKYSAKLGKTVFASAFEEEQSRSLLDNLNLLYVAFTRAESGMIVLAPTGKNGPPKNLVARWVYDAIAADPELLQNWNAGSLEYSTGEIKSSSSIPSPTVAADEMTSYTVGRWRDTLVIRQSGASFFNPESDVRAKINYGIHMHAVLSRIKYAKDWQVAVESLVQDGYLQTDECEELSGHLKKLMEHQIISSWFAEEWSVKTEVPILIPGGAESRIDRLLLKDKKAIVIDYKTGEKAVSDQQQVKSYIDILKKMGYSEVEGYLLYLRDLDIVSVHKSGSNVTKAKDDKQLGLF
jgi:ATP-dependent exoDNAse (exonuclease V) beta subunit